MNTKAKDIADRIKKLLDELVNLPNNSSHKTISINKSTKTKGASGALNILINEGFFDEPRELSLILNKLKELGRFYSTQLVAMNLLNLAKRRVLSRVRTAKTKSWNYVIRK